MKSYTNFLSTLYFELHMLYAAPLCAWCVFYLRLHELYFTLGLSSLWVVFHFSQIDRSEIFKPV